MKNQSGISLIELILVLGVMGVLVGLFIVSRNPATQAAINNNTQREFDVAQIAQSAHQYKIHHKDSYPKTNEGESIVTCPDEGEEVELTPASSLTEALVSDYLTKIPTDPQTDGQYLLCLLEDSSRLKIVAPDAQLGKTIELIR